MNKKGHKLSAAIVLRYGAYLRPSLYEHLNASPMSREQALAAEARLAGTGRLLVRASGTEPKLRVMAEGQDGTLVEAVVGELVALIQRDMTAA